MEEGWPENVEERGARESGDAWLDRDEGVSVAG